MQTHPSSSHRRKEIAKITDPAKRRVTFSKRRDGLFKKTAALCELTSAHAAVIVYSETGKAYSFGKPTAESVISEYLRCQSELMPPEGQRGWVAWFEEELNSCATVEGLDSLIAMGEVALDCARKKLEEVAAGGHSAVGVCYDSEVLNNDCESYMTSLVNVTAGVASSVPKSAPLHSVINGCTCNAATGGSSGVASIPTCFDLEGRGFKSNNFCSLSEHCIGAGDRDGLLTLPENSAVDGGSFRERSEYSDHEGYGYNPYDFAGLEEMVSLVI